MPPEENSQLDAVLVAPRPEIALVVMEIEQIVSDGENVAVASVEDTEKPVGLDKGAGDAATPHSERLRRKSKKFSRTNSKEGDSTPPTPLPKYRSWKNSRRPRNGHGRGLPKKGTVPTLFSLLSLIPIRSLVVS